LNQETVDQNQKPNFSVDIAVNTGNGITLYEVKSYPSVMINLLKNINMKQQLLFL